MGCAVAPLAGLSCHAFGDLFVLVYFLLALWLVGSVISGSSPKTKLRNSLIAIGVVLAPPVYLYVSSAIETSRRNTAFFEVSTRFQQLCFERAHETIHEQATAMRELVLASEPGPTDRHGVHLFRVFGKTWGAAPITRDASGSAEGVFELRFSYLPERFNTRGTDITFHGMKMQVIDRARGAVLAERFDYMWGANFYRGSQCVGSDWDSENKAFLERVLGPQSPTSKIAGIPSQWQQSITHARLTKVETVDKVLGSGDTKDALPPGSVYDYNHRTIRLKDGEFRMPLYGNEEPLPIIASVSKDDEIAFFMLPLTPKHNWPLYQLRINQRKNTGEALRDTFVLIPPGVDWKNGWGFDKADVSISPSKVSFSIYGAKAKNDSTPAFRNPGRYRKRFVFEAPLREADK